MLDTEELRRLGEFMALHDKQVELRRELLEIKETRARIVPELIGEVVGEFAVFFYNGTAYFLEGDIDEYLWIKVTPVESLGHWNDCTEEES